MNFGRVAVLMGGPSAEREISLNSGNAVLTALVQQGVDAFPVDADRNVLARLQDGGADRAFVALHGRWGEDGVIQGALETVQIPYTGSGVAGCALAMDKVRSKQIWQSTGIPTARFVELRSVEDLNTALTELGLPLFVKPSREGSSIGASRVNTEDELEHAWRRARESDRCVIAEPCIQGMEVTIAILGEQALPAIRLQTPRTFYDYDAKYHADTTQYLCPSGLTPEFEQELKQQALRAFVLLGCDGWGRVDLMLDDHDNAYFLEANTVPGMTDHSLVPMAAKVAGLSFDELVISILETSR